MNLKAVVDRIFEDSRKNTDRGMSAIAEAETYLQQSYEGRYFFELIQNVRDANKAANMDGKVVISLTDRVLSIANSGAEFSEAGIEGITTIGRSTKKSQDFIGFKGIGFKSVQDITHTPRIVTRYGTVLFDRTRTYEVYEGNIDQDEIPLFFFPYFEERSLSAAEIEAGIVTKVELPLMDDVEETDVVDAFARIYPHQLILLGNIESLSFKSKSVSVEYLIKTDPKGQKIELRKNSKEKFLFRRYSPAARLALPVEAVATLSKKERSIFGSTPNVDLSVVFNSDEKSALYLDDEAKLYLFYPLEITSGFRFIIHSYFIVNPERKALRDSPFNGFLLEAIATYLTCDMLDALKMGRVDAARVLTFSRNTDSKLSKLYNSVVQGLKSKRFVYDRRTQDYFTPGEVLLVSKESHLKFLGAGKLGEKALVFQNDAKTVDWLQREFNVEQLTRDRLLEEIEAECKRQAAAKNLDFFKSLYDYVVSDPYFSLAGRKTLIDDHWELLSNEDEVFYRKKGTPVPLSERLTQHIHFLHSGISIIEDTDARARIGCSKFETEDLVKRLLSLFGTSDDLNADILNGLLKLEISPRLDEDLLQNVLVPIKGTPVSWLSPMTHPVYFPTTELLALYPDGNFVDETLLSADVDKATKDNFFARSGVWRIPAIYIFSGKRRLKQSDSRQYSLTRETGFSTLPFTIINDRVLHKPSTYVPWFTRSVIENWKTYREFITSTKRPAMAYISAQSSIPRTFWPNDQLLRFSGFIEDLKHEKWIICEDDAVGYLPSEVLGMYPHEHILSSNQILRRHLKTVAIYYSELKDFMKMLRFIHLRSDDFEDYCRLLRNIYETFKERGLQIKEFPDFYNKILNRVFDYFLRMGGEVDLTPLKKIHFLAIDDLTREYSWALSTDIFYLDDKPAYDLLPREIKSLLQPQFTNRDKGTIGRIVSGLGRRVKDSVSREMQESAVLKQESLIEFVPELPECIALLEKFIEKDITEDFVRISSVVVNHTSEVKLTINVADRIVSLTGDYFVDDGNSFSVHVASGALTNMNKVKSGLLEELFVKLRDRELRLVGANFLHFLESQDRDGFLRSFDIQPQRVSEIIDQITASELSDVQRFWDAVLRTKGITYRAGVFNGSGIDIVSVAALLGLQADWLEGFHVAFQYTSINHVSNLPLLTDLLQRLSTSGPDLSAHLSRKIDFRSHHEDRLKKILHKFESYFTTSLHRYLQGRTRSDQEQFQETIDEYKWSFRFDVPDYVVDFDADGIFLTSLNREFPFDVFSKCNLEEIVDTKWLNSRYIEQHSALKVAMASTAYSEDQLRAYLTDGTKRSLLYFDNVPYLASDFKEWLQRTQVQPGSGSQENIDELLDKYSGTGAEIESADAAAVEGQRSNGRTNGGSPGGGRVDGSGGDGQKFDIGLVAEMLVFEELAKVHGRIKWVSKNASKISNRHAGYNPEGLDGLGYDIEYLDEQGTKHLVEVKGRSDVSTSFIITDTEVGVALRSGKRYHVYFVMSTLKPEKRIINLGNLFCFDEGQDFFKNEKFKAEYKNFEIIFKIR